MHMYKRTGHTILVELIFKKCVKVWSPPKKTGAKSHALSRRLIKCFEAGSIPRLWQGETLDFKESNEQFVGKYL